MRKLKILQVNKLYYPVRGGIEKVVQQLAEGLNDITNMRVLVCQQKGKSTDEIINGVNVHRSSSKGILFSLPISFTFFIDMKKMLSNIDVLQIHMPFPLADIAFLMTGYKGKVVLWWHSDIVRQKKMMFFYKPIMTHLLRRADKIIVATEGHIEGSAYLKPYHQKCVVIPYGVDNEVISRGESYLEKKSKQKQYELNNKDKKTQDIVKFLFTGRLVYYKGCDILLKAFVNVPNAILTLIGTGTMESELKKMASDLGLMNRVRFLGDVSIEELYKEYEECDVFILPSILRSEAFGLVQIEAMAFGKPVINTKLPSGVPYVSLHNITGLTVEPGSIVELEKAMIWMIEHPEERLIMGKEARKRVIDNYTIENMLDNVLELYELVMKEG